MSQLFSLLRNRNIQLLLSCLFLGNVFQLGTALFAFYVLSILTLTPEQWGYIIFIGYITSTVTSFVGGSVADLIGRKKTYLLGVPLIGLGWLSLAFSRKWVHVAVAYGTMFFVMSMSGMVGGTLWTKLGVLSFLLPILVCSIASTIISVFVK